MASASASLVRASERLSVVAKRRNILQLDGVFSPSNIEVFSPAAALAQTTLTSPAQATRASDCLSVVAKRRNILQLDGVFSPSDMKAFFQLQLWHRQLQHLQLKLHCTRASECHSVVAKKRNIPQLDGVFSPSYMKAFFPAAALAQTTLTSPAQATRASE